MARLARLQMESIMAALMKGEMTFSFCDRADAPSFATQQKELQGKKKEGRDAAFVLLPGQKYQINAAITIANSLLGGLLSRQIGTDVVLVQVFDVIDFFLNEKAERS